MSERLDDHAIGLLGDIHDVVSSSLLEIAGAFSAMLRPLVGHSALIIFTEDCTGRPQKKAGDASIIDRVTIAELDVVRESMLERIEPVWGNHGNDRAKRAARGIMACIHGRAARAHRPGAGSG